MGFVEHSGPKVLFIFGIFQKNSEFFEFSWSTYIFFENRDSFKVRYDNENPQKI